MARTHQVIGPNATTDTNVAVNQITRDAVVVSQQETIIAHPTNDNTLQPNANGSINVVVESFPATQVVSGTVELGTTSLNALENINVTVQNSSVEVSNDVGNPIPVSGTVTANTGLSQPLTDSQLRATPVSVGVASSELPTGASTEATLAALKSTADSIQSAADAIKVAVEALNTKIISANTTDKATEATLQAINNMNESMLYMLSGMLDKMPRLTREDKLPVVLVSDGASNNEPTSAYYAINTGTVGDPSSGKLMYRMFEPWNFSDTGSARLYQQIQVS
ncbi:MAG TPA: hypothetical protein PK317_02325 [Coprothermobacter proteolyticus]|nr:hypothetical protein [Coprothermobacter proteolyticus]